MKCLVVEAVRFLSNGFRLEGELVYADGPIMGGIVVAGPHPLLGGTMGNNVVQGLADGLAREGFGILRFNYRGSGNSDGPRADVESNLAEFLATSHVPDEPAYGDDLVAATDFLCEAIGDCASLALVGYSFGCSLLPAAAAPGIPLVLVAPTIGTHNYAAFRAMDNPLLVIASEDRFRGQRGTGAAMVRRPSLSASNWF